MSYKLYTKLDLMVWYTSLHDKVHTRMIRVSYIDPYLYIPVERYYNCSSISSISHNIVCTHTLWTCWEKWERSRHQRLNCTNTCHGRLIAWHFLLVYQCYNEVQIVFTLDNTRRSSHSCVKCHFKERYIQLWYTKSVPIATLNW